MANLNVGYLYDIQSIQSRDSYYELNAFKSESQRLSCVTPFIRYTWVTTGGAAAGNPQHRKYVKEEAMHSISLKNGTHMLLLTSLLK
jgi:hypothetical protein